MLSVTPSRRFQSRADDWIRTSINRFTRPAPFSVEPCRLIKHEREESNPVRQFWRLAALPGAHSCEKHSRRLEPGAIVVNYFASSTFQYASLMNFDQLSIRTSCAV